MLRRRFGLLTGVLALSLATAACTGDPAATPGESPSETPVSSSTTKPVEKPRTITFGVYGAPAELDAMQRAVDGFNATSVTRKVKMITWPDHEAALDAVLSGDAPDVFMASRVDLGQLVENEAVQPVSLLLDERGVDFGDRFSRDAVDAFASADELQCMAYSASPMVIYYNDELVDFDKMERRGLPVPSTERERWSLEEFAAAAQFASRKGDKRGVWVDPTLQGLAPFIHSGGGKIFDDEEDPTSLAFSDESTREALNRILPILRDPTLTPSDTQLENTNPLRMFKRGQLAMIAGFRDLVPELRSAKNLSFDVIGRPVLDDRATVGDISGLCISADTEVPGDAADVIAYMVSDSAVETVASTGYIVPTNTQVAGSDVFLNPRLMPENAQVFSNGIRYLVVPPFISEREALAAAVGPHHHPHVNQPGNRHHESTTHSIDPPARGVQRPDEESESPTE